MKYVAVLVFVGICLVAPSPGWSTYQTVTVVSQQNETNGLVRVNVKFTGDAGEPEVNMAYIIRPGFAMKDIRVWARENLDDLNGVRTSAALAGLQTGQVIVPTNRTPPTQTDKQIWNEKFRNYLHSKDGGIVAAAAELAAIKADLEATYQSGYLAP